MTSPIAQRVVTDIDRAFGRVTRNHQVSVRTHEVGRVAIVSRGVAQVTGLAHAFSEEVLEFSDGARGIAINLDRNKVMIGKRTAT